LYEDFIRADARHYVCNSLLTSLSGIRTIKCTLKFELYKGWNSLQLDLKPSTSLYFTAFSDQLILGM